MAESTMIQRMVGAALLDVETYEEVEHDSSATGQAAGVVAMVAVAQAIAATGKGLLAVILAPVGALVGWLVWAGITYVIGDKLFGGEATWGEMLRTLGFAQTPGILLLLVILPLGVLLVPFVFIWMLVAAIIAIRQALDFGTGKAILTAIVGWVVLAIYHAIFSFG
jgi:hypothetical protein